ncbi:uncharacterized protein LOC122652786 [Telopea speciosissima]|uniref:uncharacterized protein LOC122652786 n=1 Tax=Telopea speciosissima TaxID=54955 RepID=UPI001CC68772|nr:uncharacterized protein LOC122652786 [Telopea speciosissima]
MWRLIWASNTLPKIKAFLWRACAGGLALTTALHQRQVPVDTCCRRCGAHEESIDHILLKCTFARVVWFGCNLHPLLSLGDNFHLYQFLQAWISLADWGKSTFKEVTALCCFVLWYLWTSRNDLLFSGKVWTGEELIQAAKRVCDEFFKATSIAHPSQAPSRVPGQVSWLPPLPGSFKLNCDVSLDPGTKRSGVGFVIRDHVSRCCIAVSNPTPFNEILVGEAMAIREGLLEAISEGTLSITVESDNLGIISSLLNPSKILNFIVLPIVEDIRHISTYFDACNFAYIPRAANSLADCLARRALSVAGRMVWPNSDPLFSEAATLDSRSVSRSLQ